MQKLLIFSYLLAIVVANLSVTHFGKWALPFTAFLLIPFDLVARDVLHEEWKDNSKVKMYLKLFLLILSGGILSYLINQDSAKIALASCVTFLSVGIINTSIFQMLIKKKILFRMNLSNGVSAIIDSLLFPAVAFGIFEWRLFLSQSGAKIVGGLIFAYVFVKRMENGNRCDKKN